MVRRNNYSLQPTGTENFLRPSTYFDCAVHQTSYRPVDLLIDIIGVYDHGPKLQLSDRHVSFGFLVEQNRDDFLRLVLSVTSHDP